MRQVVLDTETTGIDPRQGHRIIEIGCVELMDRKLTGNHYHVYINPERVVEEEADDTIYWMELLIESQIVQASRVDELLNETNEITAMTVASIRTLRERY